MIFSKLKKNNSKIFMLQGIGEIKIQKKKQNKNIKIKIKPPGIVSVSMPVNADFKHAETFLNEKHEWIIKHLDKLGSKAIPKDIIDESTNFKTEKHTLKLHTHSQNKLKCRIIDSIINIYYPETCDIGEDFIQKHIRKGIAMALKSEAEVYLPLMLNYWSNQTGLNYKNLTLVNSKRHWGLCMQDNSIKLNVHLMRLPRVLIDYVILHELAHVREKNHSARFYEFLETLLPEHKQLSKDLKKYSPQKFLTF